MPGPAGRRVRCAQGACRARAGGEREPARQAWGQSALWCRLLAKEPRRSIGSPLVTDEGGCGIRRRRGEQHLPHTCCVVFLFFCCRQTPRVETHSPLRHALL